MSLSQDLKSWRVGVLGAGTSGRAAAQLLARKGARVLLSEKGLYKGPKLKGVTIEQGGHSDALLSCDLLVRSPGVPNHLPILKKAAQKKIPLWSEIELAARFSRTSHMVAITGTNGKTTTTTLVGDIFKASRFPTLVGGNIGTPLADLIERATPRTRVILELSSYQLEDIETFHPEVSAILNVTPDHLEHHGTMEAYAAAKARIFMNQRPTDVCVLNAEDAWCRRFGRRSKAQILWFSRQKSLASGIYFKAGQITLNWKGQKLSWPLKSKLPGPHNIENILAAYAIALAGGIPLPTIRRRIERFPGVEHRLEHVRTLNGVDYINDSKGTNVDSTRVALASFDRPIVLIAGGQGKGSSYRPLRYYIKDRVKTLLLIGEDALTIRKELGDLKPSENVKTMVAAVRRAAVLSRPGDIVLLSPACASFDQYQNYEHRGRDFKTLVKRLHESQV
jgi:UDP-N-acetylmuramoylalanine--D-glutamate ligase